MTRLDLTRARVAAANAQAALDVATARIRELEGHVGVLNARLIEANERADTAEFRLAAAYLSSDASVGIRAKSRSRSAS